MPQPSDLVFFRDNYSLLAVAFCGIVAFAFILWEHERRRFSTRSDNSQAGNPAQKNQTQDSPESARLDAGSNQDKDILACYVFSSYVKFPESVKEAIELELVQALVRQADRRTEGTAGLRELCTDIVVKNNNLKSLLLQCWKSGSFQAFRNDENLMSLIHTYIDDQTRKTTPNSGPPLVTGCLTLQETTIPPMRQEDSGKPVEKGDSSPVRQNTTKLANSIGRNTFNISNSNLHDVKITAAAGDLWEISYSGDHEARVASWLSSIDQRSIHNDIAKKRTDGTGDWFLESKQCSVWTTNPYRRVLWCPGIPGVGKTVMASLTVDYLRRFDSQTAPPSKPIAVAFVYFNYQRQEQQDLLFTIECLSRQVYEITQASCLNSAFDKLHSEHTKHGSRPLLDELIDALSSTINQFRQFYVVLDALDEYLKRYSDEAIQSLLHTLLSLGEHVKIMATSRVIGQMEDIFEKFDCLREVLEANPDDLSEYIRHRVAKADFQFLISEELTQQVVDQVRDAAKGRFLIAELHMNSLQLQISPGHLKDALASLPDEIDGVYTKAMQRIDGYADGLRKELAKRTFMWLTRSRHPLSIGQLQHVLAIEPERKNIIDYISPQSTITFACAGLVVVEDEKVTFIHYTTQEFFLKAYSKQFSDAQVASQCLDYILLPCFHDLAPNYLSGHHDCEDDSSYIRPQYKLLQTYSFYGYAASNWGYHLNHSEPGAEESLQVKKRVISVLERGGMALNLSLWYILRKLHWNEAVLNPEPDSISTGIFLSIYHNQPVAFQKLLAKVDDFPKICLGPTPFHIAAQCGRAELLGTMLERWGTTARSNTCKSIIVSDDLEQSSNDTIASSPESRKFDINTVIKSGGYCLLFLAAWYDNVSVIELLLSYPDIDVNLQSAGYPPTPLGIAVVNRSTSAVALLLSHPDINVNDSSDLGDTILMRVVMYGPTAMAKLLLGHPDIDVNATHYRYGHTALALAARMGHESIVQLLLEQRDIDINLTDITSRASRTPLHAACQGGHDNIVQLLLNHADIKVNDVSGQWISAIGAAVSGGKASTVELVLKDPRVNFNIGRRALFDCLESEESEAIFDLLLADCRFRPDNLGAHFEGLTALMIAAVRGRESICHKLLKHGGTDVNSQDLKGNSALIYAAARSHGHIVQMLLSETPVDINHQNSHGITALSAACINEPSFVRISATGERQVIVQPEDKVLPTVQLLLSYKEIDINLGDVDGYTPVDYARKSSYTEIVNLLEAKGGIGKVPIEELTDLSLEKGVVVMDRPER